LRGAKLHLRCFTVAQLSSSTLCETLPAMVASCSFVLFKAIS